MSNPVFTRNKVFTERTPGGYPTMPGYQVGGGATQTYPGDAPQVSYAPERPQQFPTPQGQEQYGTTSASRPVTMDDVLIKTVVTFGTLLLFGAGSWALTATNPGLGMSVAFVSMLVALVLGLVNSFKRCPSPALILGYAAFEGVMLGGISSLFAALYDGVVVKAIVATLVTTLVMLVLFKTKVVRNSPTLMRVITVGMFSIFVFYLGNMVVSLIAIGLAAFSLVTDFDYIVTAVDNGAPQETAWTAAFGLMVTLIWLYIEFLRIFAYFASDNN
ncbi:Bax inhibitor-1/YccA family protein [Mobiluncus curtisii]|uniref:Bax inhibitor-1/YccA family protein n=1 Tax=Mobiluncus curtisii TaxID=2051 RepID=UPI0014704804|nr:Bax inhibitor-1/YccA family protein [Mobiluncus curtisii]NMW43529.1 Bax inhibitor-1/YccA family protein [Mobiluncus curtisii]